MSSYVGVWRYGWSRALANLRGAWATALGTLVVLTAALAVLGMVALLYVNVEHLGRLWLSNTTVSLFLNGDMDPAGRQALLERVKASPLVLRAQLIAPRDALQQLAERLGADHALMQGLDESALPYAIDIEVAVDYRKRLGEAARQLRALAGVEDVVYSERLLDKVQAFFTVVQWVGIGFVSLVALAFGLIVAHGTRLSLYARREEVEILDLVGAPGRLIRGAFVLEGMLIALGAWVAALALVALAYAAIREGVQASPLAPWVQGQTVFLPWTALGMAGAAAVALAAFSAWLAVTRLLRELTP
jgi:cell division transport system permease protein